MRKGNFASPVKTSVSLRLLNVRKFSETLSESLMKWCPKIFEFITEPAAVDDCLFGVIDTKAAIVCSNGRCPQRIQLIFKMKHQHRRVKKLGRFEPKWKSNHNFRGERHSQLIIGKRRMQTNYRLWHGQTCGDQALFSKLRHVNPFIKAGLNFLDYAISKIFPDRICMNAGIFQVS